MSLVLLVDADRNEDKVRHVDVGQTLRMQKKAAHVM
jgi:hypothetical protein